MLHPIQELPPSVINKIKVETKNLLLKRAMADKPGSKPEDWIFRELVLGSSNVTAPMWRDLDYSTEASSGMPWNALDAGDLTAGDLSSILTSGETINNRTYIGFFGWYDRAPLGTNLAGAANQMGSLGTISHIRFKKGGSVMDHWGTRQCYAYGFSGVCGLTDRPVIYSEKDKIDVQVVAVEASLDKLVGLRAFVCEPHGHNIAPDNPYTFENIDPSNLGRQLPTYGGIDPPHELTLGEIHEIKTRARRILRRIAVDAGIVESEQAAKTKLIIREVIAGDDSDDTDAIVDIDQSSTAQTTGQENWAQDASALTAGDRSSVVAAGLTVDSRKAMAFFGFNDYDYKSDLYGILLEGGSKPKDFWQPEHCFYRPGNAGGFSKRISFYHPDDKLDIEMIFGSGSGDRFVQLRGYIIERYDDVISQ